MLVGTRKRWDAFESLAKRIRRGSPSLEASSDSVRSCFFVSTQSTPFVCGYRRLLRLGYGTDQIVGCSRRRMFRSDDPAGGITIGAELLYPRADVPSTPSQTLRSYVHGALWGLGPGRTATH